MIDVALGDDRGLRNIYVLVLRLQLAVLHLVQTKRLRAVSSGHRVCLRPLEEGGKRLAQVAALL